MRKVIYEQNNIQFAQYANGKMYAEKIVANQYKEIDQEQLMQTARKLGIYGEWKRCEDFTRWFLI